MKKNISRLVCLLLALVVCMPLVACSGSSSSSEDPSALKQQVESTLSDLKSCKGEAFQLAVQAVADAGIEDHLNWIGVTDEELTRAYLDNFDYEVGDVSVTGSSAQARVTIKCRSITAIVKDYLCSGSAGDAEAGKQALLDTVSTASANQNDTTMYITMSDSGQWDVTGALSTKLRSICL